MPGAHEANAWHTCSLSRSYESRFDKLFGHAVTFEESVLIVLPEFVRAFLRRRLRMALDLGVVLPIPPRTLSTPASLLTWPSWSGRRATLK